MEQNVFNFSTLIHHILLIQTFSTDPATDDNRVCASGNNIYSKGMLKFSAIQLTENSKCFA